ncbi:carbohydrate ABC transporter permease [Tessaracoccus palaemonis]|uniref:Sugar ABC transporter permease n=1 Tax=Tessaracoccus palaemonis TaxID=2829499 RepID=A0ABX8SIR5_9ACTN|nr:sugar ABC transporter permease [Tessaracoccus palaemonis]QXT62325.1 sugar ABC transporter permease [Tessaracoccus palaemonis]
MKRILYSQKIAPFIFVLPFVLTLAVFWISPLIKSGIMSTQNILPGVTESVGLKNFQRLFGDRLFYVALGNSIKYMLWTLLLLIPGPLILAVLINSKIGSDKFKAVFKSVLFIPALSSVVVAGVVFRLIFSESSTSLMNQIVAIFGVDPVKWLKNSGTGFFALLTLACWRWTGVNILYFLAGLQAIPQDYYEAADLDGASKWQQFWHVTVPSIKPTIVFVLTISVYGGLAMFLESFMLWGGNNSPQNIGLTIVGYLYRQGIERNNLGYASAVGIILLILVMAINIPQLIATGTFKKEER